MTTQTAQKALAPIEQLRGELNKMLPQFKMALPENVTPEKFLRVLLTGVQSNPDFLKCDRQSLYSACMKCAADGLFPDNREAALIPFGGTVQYIPMIGGIYKKLRNSKEIAFICAEVVYKDDTLEFGTSSEKGRYLEHRPKLSGARGTKENATAIFAMAKLRNGDLDFEVMTPEEIEFVRSKSKAPNSPAWRDWWGEMAKKVVVKRLAKRLPTSAEVQELFEADNEEYDLNAKAIETTSRKLKSADELSEALGSLPEDLPEEKTEKPVEATPDPRDSIK